MLILPDGERFLCLMWIFRLGKLQTRQMERSKIYCKIDWSRQIGGIFMNLYVYCADIDEKEIVNLEDIWCRNIHSKNGKKLEERVVKYAITIFTLWPSISSIISRGMKQKTNMMNLLNDKFKFSMLDSVWRNNVIKQRLILWRRKLWWINYQNYNYDQFAKKALRI